MSIPDPITYAVPVGDLKVAIPGGGHLPPEGKKVQQSPYWRRRQAEGSVGLGASLKAAQVQAKETAPAVLAPKPPKPEKMKED